jgi:uncharacterized protein (DUF736 family)
MAALGTLQPSREGGWTGSVFVLAHDVKVRLVPNDNHENAKAPSFRVYAGTAELGALWQRTAKGDDGKEYLGGELDFPGLPEPISIAVFVADDGKKALAVWRRNGVKDD